MSIRFLHPGKEVGIGQGTSAQVFVLLVALLQFGSKNTMLQFRLQTWSSRRAGTMEEEDLEQKLSHDEVVDGAEHIGGCMFGEVVKYLQN